MKEKGHFDSTTTRGIGHPSEVANETKSCLGASRQQVLILSIRLRPIPTRFRTGRFKGSSNSLLVEKDVSASPSDAPTHREFLLEPDT